VKGSVRGHHQGKAAHLRGKTEVLKIQTELQYKIASIKHTVLTPFKFIHHSFISILPQRPGWQEPEPSHVTGMALTHRILPKFLGVLCHYFPPPLDVPNFAARCLHVRNDARDSSSERWNCGRESFR